MPDERDRIPLDRVALLVLPSLTASRIVTVAYLKTSGETESVPFVRHVSL